jgi:hypothetical protein
MNDDDDILNKAAVFLSRARTPRTTDFPILTEAIKLKASTSILHKDQPGVSRENERQAHENSSVGHSDETIVRLGEIISRLLLEHLRESSTSFDHIVHERVTQILKQEIKNAVDESLASRIPEIVHQVLVQLTKSGLRAPPPNSGG